MLWSLRRLTQKQIELDCMMRTCFELVPGSLVLHWVSKLSGVVAVGPHLVEAVAFELLLTSDQA